jgi:Ca2+-binding EF-hand superfamily protein
MVIAATKTAIAKMFSQLDANGDGFLQEDDFVRYGEKLTGQFGYRPDSGKARSFIDKSRNRWKQMQAAMDTDGDQRISRDEFIKYHNDKMPREQFDAFADAIFELADANDNDKLNKAEFVKLQKVRGGSDVVDADEVLRRYDKGGAGGLTKAEYRRYLEDSLV